MSILYTTRMEGVNECYVYDHVEKTSTILLGAYSMLEMSKRVLLCVHS